MRFLITGIGGFAGPHLARALLDAGHTVHGVVRRRGSMRALEPLHMQFGERFPSGAVITADVLDPRALLGAVAEARPDGVFHLAGVTYVPASETDPLAAHRTNFFGSLNVLRAVGEVRPECRVLFVGSGDAYGAAGNEFSMISEEVPLQPVSPYGVSKAAADLAAFQWHWAGGNVVRARPFNHTGPGQDSRFVCSSFARQVAEIEAGQRPAVLEVGNLDVIRDFTDVEDIVAGYVALWERGEGGEVYNLCSGRAVPIRTVVDELRAQARSAIEIRVTEVRRRPNEVRRLVGTAARAQSKTGWRPARPLAETLARLLGYWRERVRAKV